MPLPDTPPCAREANPGPTSRHPHLRELASGFGGHFVEILAGGLAPWRRACPQRRSDRAPDRENR